MTGGTNMAGPDQGPQDGAPPADPRLPPKGGPALRLAHRALGYAALALAAAGAVLPVLPTVPFLLVAAWAFARSDPGLVARLHRNPRFGPLLRDWQREGAIPTRAKVLSLVMMAASWVLVAATASGPLVPALVGATLAAVALYIVTRPAPGGATPPR